MQLTFKPRALGVQGVMLCSAGMSAAYYASQAPEVALSIAGLAFNPAALALGAMACALDLTKPQMMQVAGTADGLGKRAVAGAIFAVLFLASMIAVDGMLMRLRSDWAGERGNTIDTHAKLKADVERLTAEIAKTGDTRPVSTIDALLEGSVDANVWRRSKKCTDISRADTAEACKPALALYEERGRSARKAELEPQLNQASADLADVKPPKAADPQAKSLADALGMPESVIGYLLVAVIGFGLELVSCFGLWLLIEKPKAAADGPMSDEQRALAWVREQIDMSGGKLALLNSAIAGRFEVHPATATRWRQSWIEQGDIEETRDGRTIILRRAR